MKRSREEAAEALADQIVREEWNGPLGAAIGAVIRAQQLAFGRRLLERLAADSGFNAQFAESDRATIERLLDEDVS